MINNNVKKTIIHKLDHLKHTPFGTVYIQYIFNKHQHSLFLLTSDCEKNQNLMYLLGKWRKENEMFYLSQFPVTIERTTKWFREKVIDAPDRLLFLVKSPQKYVGHIGLFRFNFDDMTCELDNILRGESDYPGVIGESLIHMMDWGKNTLRLRGYTLKVLSHNERAIRLYKRLGFSEVDKIPLIYINGDDGKELIEAPQGYDKKPDAYYIVMKRI